jgi:hypothetical protein
MLIRKLATLAAAGALGLLALGSASASATSLRTDPGNVPLSGQQTLRAASSGSAVLNGPAGTWTCGRTLIDIDVNATTAATITGRLTALTFTSCTDTIPLLDFRDCTLHVPSIPTVSITAAAGGGTVVLTDPVYRCTTSNASTGPACYFTLASAAGSFNNAASTITFTNIGVVGVTPTTDAIAPANCGGTPSQLSFQLRHILQGTSTNTVTVTTS